MIQHKSKSLDKWVLSLYGDVITKKPVRDELITITPLIAIVKSGQDKSALKKMIATLD